MEFIAEGFDALSIEEILDADSRPTFIIDLDPDDEQLPGHSRITAPVFCNSALRSHESLFDMVMGVESLTLRKKPYEDFASWATGMTRFLPSSFLYGRILWSSSTVRRRWRLISGNIRWTSAAHVHDLLKESPFEVASDTLLERLPTKKRKVEIPQAPPIINAARTEDDSVMITDAETHASSDQASFPKPFYFSRSHSESSSGRMGQSSNTTRPISLEETPIEAVPDWTVSKPEGVLSSHMLFAREINWEATPLGSIDSWSPELRQIANLCMGYSYPAALFWGAELTMLYNKAYAVEVAGNKHPALMGSGFQGPFSEVWDTVRPVFAECARTGISARRENDYLSIERHGYIEETFFSWSFTPVYGGSDRIIGFFNAPFETTKQVLSHRRMQTINQVGEYVALAKGVKYFWGLLLKGLEHNDRDVPFAILYSVGDEEDEDRSTTSSDSAVFLKPCKLEGSIGIPIRHPAAPQRIDLKDSQEGFTPSLRTSTRTREPTLLRTRDGTLPEELLTGIVWRGFGEPCCEAIIFPLLPTNSDTVMAFLILGVNPRRRYDAEYQAFSSMLNRQVATSLACVILFEEEIRRSKDAAEAAALQQEQLTQALSLQTSRLRRMTTLSPLGMFNISPKGIIQEANDRYFEMTGHPRDKFYEFSFMERVHEASQGPLMDGWHRMVVDHLSYTGEIQLNTQAVRQANLEGAFIEYWVLVSAQPEFTSDGSLISIIGSITDISHLKWAQGLQEERLKEAEETRRSQNEFIDVTCHEIRNPLSAILQCADDISSTMGCHVSQGTLAPLDVVENCKESADTIALCVQHQKAIVDDILTVSKLDSNLLKITPATVKPMEIAKRAVKMFDAELQSKDIQVVFKAHPSLQEMKIDWMVLDPSRVLQILINLMTNAIKFTATSDRKRITVSVTASREPPAADNAQHFEYIPTKGVAVNPTAGDDWGGGEVVFLRLEVQDTGCGLNEAEMQQLFKKFSQASPRTHAQYGGSGLGLYICRQLAELHGGQIGVASQAGMGSIFGFYVMGRKSEAPGHVMPRCNTAHTPDYSGGVSVSQAVATPVSQDALITPRFLPDFDPKNLDILVVEDNLVNQKILVQQLRKIGVSVNAANDGCEALAYLEGTSYLNPGGRRLSVILMDLEMPNMDGLTCVGTIRKMEKTGIIQGHVPVIAITANVREGQITEALDSGMDGLLSKPFKISDVLLKIKALLGDLASMHTQTGRAGSSW